MNKEIENKAQALNQWILSQSVVVEFQKYEKLIHDNPELVQLETELKEMQQAIVKCKHQQGECQELILKYETKKKDFDENPLVYNYLILKQEVNDLIHQIQDDINEQLQKKVD